MDIDLTNRTSEHQKSRAIIKLAKKAGRLVGLPKGALISIVFVDATKIREINKEYRGKDEATDVLSFLYNPTSPPPMAIGGGIPHRSSPYKGRIKEGLFITPKFVRPVFGEIFLCPEMIRVKASERGSSEEEYQKLLIVHAMLHLKGMGHENNLGAEEMESEEKKTLDKI